MRCTPTLTRTSVTPNRKLLSTIIQKPAVKDGGAWYRITPTPRNMITAPRPSLRVKRSPKSAIPASTVTRISSRLSRLAVVAGIRDKAIQSV